MATDINIVSISGNITRDSELKHTTSGTPVLSFGVAVNESRKNQQTGEWEDRPNFIDCTMWGARAEKLQQYLTKGRRVALNGRLHFRSWEAQDGSKRSKLEVVADNLVFMSTPNQQPQQAQQQRPQQQQGADGDFYDSDIPF